MAGGGGPMEFMQLIVDFVTLGAFGLFATATLTIWYGFCDIFIFGQGYLRWINKYRILKFILIMISGIVIWGTALYYVHKLMWSGLT